MKSQVKEQVGAVRVDYFGVSSRVHCAVELEYS